jgi:hypothetical protein
MRYLKELYRKDPRRWIPTVAIVAFLVILTLYTIRDGFMTVWPGWAVIGLTTIAYVWNLIYEIRKKRKRDKTWPGDL